MSGLSPVFDPLLPGADDFNGEGLSGDLEKIDEIAAFLRLTPLSEFVDAYTMALEILDEEDIPTSCPPVSWYLPQEGLATVQGLLLYIEQNPERPFVYKTTLVADLELLATLLDKADSQQAKFHLLVDM